MPKDQSPHRPDDRIPVLVSTATRLMDQVEELAQESGHQLVDLAKRSRTNRHIAVVAIVGLIVDVFLSLLLIAGYKQLDELTSRLNTAQTTTRQRALCPLYQVFLSSQSDEARKQSPDPESYDQAFKVIRRGYNALHCDDFIKGDDPRPPNG